jgi:peptidoglycan/LPS O-acetylase OafA/YrhL
MISSDTRASYRRDIDGLRALAVLSVVLFHFKIFPDYVGGGFVGVDIFFVISGFLITRIIFTGVEDGSYSVVGFYDRRIRRIFPALILLYLVCLSLAFFLNFPSEAANVSKSVIASAFFVSNIFFYGRSGYFDRDSETNPLLHTWSLSVEEQFYIIFPLLVFAIRKFNQRARIWIISAAALASFLAACYMVSADASAAFYLVQYRAWELALGSLLAIGALPTPSRWIAEAVAAIGLALVCGSFVFISRTLPFPGITALAPCAGAAAIIFANSSTQTLVGYFLSLRPLQFTGLISYSLYLLHWPAIVFFRLFHEPSRAEKLLLVLVSIILATVSWSFIEKPFRKRPHRLSQRTTLVAGCAAMAGVAIAALLVVPGIYLLWRYPSRALDVMAHAKIDESHLRTGSCFITAGYTDEFEKHDQDSCLSTKQDRPNYLLIGDSHAAHLWSGLRANYPSINFLQATASGCRPIFGEGGEQHCTGLIHYIYDRFLPTQKLDGILISAQWAPKDLPNIISTVDILKRYVPRVIVIGPTVQYIQPLPRILARAIILKRPETELASQYRRTEEQATDVLFATTLKAAQIEYASAYRALCHPECEVWAAADVPIQFDDDHFTREGSAYIVKRLDLHLQ